MDSGSMLTKIGLCLLICGAAHAVSSEEIGGEYLGKLRFVELPGIIEVFSQDQRLSLDIGGSCTSDEDGLLLTICGADGKVVPAPGSGRVRGAENGAVELWTEGDITVCIAGLSQLSVEEGQPVARGDTLGTAGDSVAVRVYKSGRPVSVLEYIDTGGAI